MLNVVSIITPHGKYKVYPKLNFRQVNTNFTLHTISNVHRFKSILI